MRRSIRLSLLAVLALTLMLVVMPSPAAARGFVRGGFYGGWGWGPAWGYGWGPGWYGAGYWGPGYYYLPNAGNVKIVTPKQNKDDAVYIDGGFVGTVAKMHKFALRPGAHDLAVQAPNGQTVYNQRIEVLRGKTTEIHAGA